MSTGRAYAQAAARIKAIGTEAVGQAQAKISTTRVCAQANARITKGTYGLWINKTDRTAYILNQQVSFKLNSLDATLIDPPTLPAVGQVVTFDVPYWTGSITAVQTTDNDRTGHKWVSITATNSDVAVVTAAPISLVDTNSDYRKLQITTSLEDGVTETRGELETFRAGLYPGMTFALTSATHGYVAQNFSIKDVEVGFLKPSQPIYRVTFGDAIVTMSVWINSASSNDIFPIDSTKITDGSVTTPKLASNAVTTDKLDANVVVANVANVGNTVTIDNTGITINDGALTINDEFDSTAMEASGFTGSWAEFLALGLYNARFTHGTAGVVGNGRTSALPYWTVSDVAGSGTLTFLNPTAKFTFASTTDVKKIVSDKVSVHAEMRYEFGCVFSATSAAGAGVGITLTRWVEWFNDNDFALGQSTPETISVQNGGSQTNAVFGQPVTAPDDAAKAQVVITAQETVTHSASNTVTVSAAYIRQIPREFDSLTIDSALIVGDLSSYTTSVLGALGSLTVYGFYRQGGTATSFPASPVTNDLYFREDYGLWFYYDGTRWLSVQLFTVNHVGGADADSVLPITITNTDQWRTANPLPLTGASDIYLVNHTCQFFVNSGGTALGASHKWVGTFRKRDSADTATTIATINIDSGSSAVWRTITTNINALLQNGTTYYSIASTWTKTGTPGSLFPLETFSYRLVAT